MLLDSELSDAVISVLLNLLGLYRHREAAATVEELMRERPSREILIHGIETLSFIGDSSTAERLLPYLEHEVFVVRLKTLHALQRLGGETYFDVMDF